MRKHTLAHIISALSLGGVTHAWADSVTLFDYTEATSAYEDAYINGQFNMQDGNQEQSSYNLDLDATYDRVFSSADRNIKIELDGETSRERGPNSGDKSESYYQATGAVTSDQYFTPGSNAGFWYGKGEVGIQKDMEDPYSKVMFGLGYGRVVNATPMAKSIRLIESLQERGLLSSTPTKAQYQAVASVISKEDQYRSQHGSDDYALYWIEDIEKALGQSLTTRGAIKSFDVLSNERISTRKYGWLVRGGVGAVLSDYDGSSSKPALELGAEYHYPLSNQLQFSNEAELTTTLDDGDNSYHATNDMTLTYEVSDRVDWENAWGLSYAAYDESNDITTNTLSSTYRYYLSNQLSFTVTGRLTNVEDEIKNNGNDKVDRAILMGLTYRLK